MSVPRGVPEGLTAKSLGSPTTACCCCSIRAFLVLCATSFLNDSKLANESAISDALFFYLYTTFRLPVSNLLFEPPLFKLFFQCGKNIERKFLSGTKNLFLTIQNRFLVPNISLNFRRESLDFAAGTTARGLVSDLGDNAGSKITEIARPAAEGRA